jgi:uncharacterized damage-inducible protein DinB
MTPELAQQMAHYNQWMNQRMYDAAAQLGTDRLKQNQGAFFGSVFGTLQHMAVADTIWLLRFATHGGGFAALAALQNGPRPTALNQQLFEHWADLRAYRQQLDAMVVAWSQDIEPSHLAQPLHYTNMAGVKQCKAFAPLVAHFFNHQTHHRGQASTLLHQLGVDMGVTDLLALIPDALD